MPVVFASVRGYVENPRLLKIDLNNQVLCDMIEVIGLNLDHVPLSKRGFTGLQYYDGALYAATWDQICVIDPGSGKVIGNFTHHHFSDLHGLHIDQKGTIWITSTNLDSVYVIRNNVIEPYWQAWQCPDLGSPLSFVEKDYRHVIKEDSPYHRYHINGVLPTDNYVFLSFLGSPLRNTILNRTFRKLKLLKTERRGGIFVIDRENRSLLKKIRLEGLHDSHEGKDDHIYYTEYFGNAVIRLDPNRLSVKRIPLEIPPYSVCGYLSRGIFPEDDSFWIGHTMLRGWVAEDTPYARIRNYDIEGQWKGKDVALPGYVGVYAITESG
jgi:hypothetical protein